MNGFVSKIKRWAPGAKLMDNKEREGKHQSHSARHPVTSEGKYPAYSGTPKPGLLGSLLVPGGGSSRWPVAASDWLYPGAVTRRDNPTRRVMAE